MNEEKKNHNKKIVEEFSNQAVVFTKIKAHYDSVETIIEMSEVSKKQHVLDMACGSGIMTTAFATKAKNVIGLDITQAMLDEAEKKRLENKLTNVEFHLGNVESLPYTDESFDIVFTRYSFHHFLEPQKVLEEMIRVCKKGGKIIIVDVALESKYDKAYNEMERLRDPSHTKALTFDEFSILLSHKALQGHKQSSYEVTLELEEQLSASFVSQPDKERLREIFKEDIIKNKLGMKTYIKKKALYLSYQISVFLTEKFI